MGIQEKIENIVYNVVKTWKCSPINIDELSQIADNIYVSNWDTAVDDEILKRHRIDTVICLNTFKKTEDELKIYRENSIKHFYIEIEDMYDEDFYSASEKLRNIFDGLNADNKILFHCTAGISRSPSATIYYLCSVLNMSFVSACTLIQTKRQCAFPQDTFLMSILKKLYDEGKETLKE